MKHLTDDEIEKAAGNPGEEEKGLRFFRAGFIAGAKWVRDQQPKPSGSIENEADHYIETFGPEYQKFAKQDFIAGGLKGMEIQKEIDRQEIERLKKALHRSLVLLGVYKPEKFKNTMLENEYDAIKSEGTELLKGYR